MALASLCTPTSPRAKVDFARIDVSDADAHTMTGYSGAEVSTSPGTPSQYPSAPAVVGYLTFEEGGTVYGKSESFTASTDGDFRFDNYLFPHAGSWTVRLSDASDDSSLKTLAVTVQ